jgi:hypothetical protein
VKKLLVILSFSFSAHADCLTERINQLEEDVITVNEKQPMDNLFVWMAEIEKVKNDEDHISRWVTRAEEAIDRIQSRLEK